MTTITAPISLGSFGTRIAMMFAGLATATGPADAKFFTATAGLHSRANYGLGRQTRSAETPISQTLCEIVAEMKESGMPISAIAEIGNVERKTVYSWLKDEAAPRQQHVDRMTAIIALLRAATDGQYRAIFRVWNLKGSDGRSLREVLSDAKVDDAAVRRTLAELDRQIKRYVRLDANATSTPRARPGSSFLDEFSEAGIG